MYKGIIKSTLLAASLILTTNASAGLLQQIQIANMLYNQDATGSNPGMSTTAVLVKGFTNGASTACFTATIGYQGSISFATGTGQTCTTAVTTVTFTPVATAIVGIAYTAPATVTLNNSFTQQLLIEQTPMSGSTSYGPVFDTTNGTVATPGTITIDVQSHI